MIFLFILCLDCFFFPTLNSRAELLALSAAFSRTTPHSRVNRLRPSLCWRWFQSNSARAPKIYRWRHVRKFSATGCYCFGLKIEKKKKKKNEKKLDLTNSKKVSKNICYHTHKSIELRILYRANLLIGRILLCLINNYEVVLS